MTNKTIKILVASATVALIVGFIAGQSRAADVTVCSTGADYTSATMAFNALPPGDNLLLCAGEGHTLNGTFRMGDMQGSVVTSYGTGTMPKVYGSRLFINSPTSNLTFRGLDFDGQGNSTHAFQLNQGISNFTIEGSILQNHALAVYTISREGQVPQSNITIRNNVIQNNSSQGVLGGGPGYYVGGNTFLNNGRNGIYDHNIYFGCKAMINTGKSCPTIIENNFIRGSSNDSQGRPSGSEIVTHGYVHGLIIRNNTIDNTGLSAQPTNYGIQLSVLPANNGESFNDVEISGNVIKGVGRAAIWIENTVGLRIFGNQIYGQVGHVSRTYGIQVLTGAEKNHGCPPTTDEVLIDGNFLSMSDSISGQTPRTIIIDSDVTGSVLVQNNQTLINGVIITDYDPQQPVIYWDGTEYVSDQIIGASDLGALLVYLGTTDKRYDINEDGAVGADDIGLLLNYLKDQS